MDKNRNSESTLQPPTFRMRSTLNADSPEVIIKMTLEELEDEGKLRMTVKHRERGYINESLKEIWLILFLSALLTGLYVTARKGPGEIG